MIQSSSFSKLSSSIERVHDVKSPSSLIQDSLDSDKVNLDNYLNSTSGTRMLPLNGQTRNGFGNHSSPSHSRSISIPSQIFQNNDSNISVKPETKKFVPAPVINSKKEAERVLQDRIAGVAALIDSQKAAAKKRTPAKKRTKEEMRKALKHTVVDIEEGSGGSDDEEEIAPETAEDRLFIAHSSEESDYSDSSDSESSDNDATTEGQGSSSEESEEDGESDDYYSEEDEVWSLLDKEDATFADEDRENDIIEKNKERDDDLSKQKIVMEKKYLRPIYMTYVPGLTAGGYGACTPRNLVTMLLNSAMSDLFTYIEMPVSRVQAILTATAEYNNRVPISKGSTEGTVLAYRLWLHVRERIRTRALKHYEGFDAMVDFLESLVNQPLLDSFFLIKKDFDVETCCVTGNPTDFGFEIVSSVTQDRVSVLWVDRKHDLTVDVCLNFLRIWFLPFTLRSFVDTRIRPIWPDTSKTSKQEIIRYYFNNIQTIVYVQIKSLIESFTATMRFFGIHTMENTELSYS